MEIRKAVITGPTGCIGNAICRCLIEKGVRVYAVCRPGSAQIKELPASDLLSVIPLELSDLSSLPAAVGDSIDAFFHLGWAGTYGNDRKNEAMQERNVSFTKEAVSAAEKLHAKVFVFAGSQSEFGPVDGIMRPDTPCRPDNPYGKAKLLAENAAKDLCAEKGIRFIACRPVSVFGLCDKPYTMVMSTLSRMLRGERLSFTKGEQMWNYIYGDDAGRAFVLSAEKGKDKSVYLVASDSSERLKDYIIKMRDIACPGAELHFGEIPYFEHQVMRLLPDITNLTEDTGFLPEISFEEGIRRTLSWLKNKQNL